MNEERKYEMRRQFDEMLDIQKQMRNLAQNNHLRIELEPDPAPPTSVESLADAMNVIRTNMNLLEIALNGWDREMNGCEVRTKSFIQADIERDKALLTEPGDSPDGLRTRHDIELHIAYDQMQLDRI